MNLFEKIGYYSLRIFCLAVGMIPTGLLYGAGVPVLAFLMHRVVKYRTKVVRKNLKDTFPQMPEEEIKGVEKRFYTHLAEVIIDAIDLAGISHKELARRITFDNSEVETKLDGHTDWVTLMGHYGSWEYFSAYQYITDRQVLGIYRPLHNKIFDRYYLRMRSRFLLPVAMNDLLRTTIKMRSEGKPIILGMIADQTPPRGEKKHSWFDFMGRPTVFFTGGEKIARKLGLPVFYLDVIKLKRRTYTAKMVEIYDGREEIGPDEITARYVKLLGSRIMDRPEYWMWSHRRWKHKSKNV